MKKRIISLGVALCLILGVFLGQAAPIFVFATGENIWSYNGVELPALPTWDETIYPYVYVGYHGSGTYVVVADNPFVYSSSYSRVEHSAKTNKIHWKLSSDGSWNLMGPYTSNSGSGAVPSKPIWCNSDILYEDTGVVWLAASEAVPLDIPSVPVYDSSFEGQSIFVEYGDSVHFYMLVGPLNGTLSCEWYVNQYLYEEVFTFTPVDDAEWAYAQAWDFHPTVAGVYTLHAVIKNTLATSSASITTSNVTVYYGVSPGGDSSGSGDNSEVMGSLETIDTNLEEVQDAVSSVEDKVDDLTEQMGEDMNVVQDQLEEGNNKLEQVVEGVTSLPQKIGDAIMGLFVPSEEDMAGIKDQWSELLSDRFGAVYDAVAIVDEIASSFKEQTTQGTITFPSVSIPLSGVDFEFGGWEVDVVPDGLEPFIQVVKKAIDIVCTLLFVNGMKSRYEKTLEGRG